MIYDTLVSIMAMTIILAWAAVVLPIMTAGCLLCALGSVLVPPEVR